MTRRKRNRPQRQRKDAWVAFSIDLTNQEMYLVESPEDTEEAVLKTAKGRHPEMVAIALNLGKINRELIRSRLAEVDVIGVEADEITDAISDFLISQIVQIVTSKPGREECRWFCGMLYSQIPVANATANVHDRFTRHYMTCEFCRSIGDVVSDDDVLTPAEKSAVDRMVEESLSRVKGEDHDL